MMEGKKVGVFGSGGNLGPIWCNTLKALGAEVKEYDLPDWDAKIEFEYPLFDITIYNAAIDNPPNSGVNFWTNYKDIVDVNLLGAIRVAKSVIPNMIMNKGGTFIVIGSIQGFIGADYRNYPSEFEKPVAYNVSKAALSQLVRSIAVQYGRNNIRAVCMAFGAVDTGKLSPEFKSKFLRNVPLGRLISKSSLRATLLYACTCPELTGQTILVDGGYTVI